MFTELKRFFIAKIIYSDSSSVCVGKISNRKKNAVKNLTKASAREASKKATSPVSKANGVLMRAGL